MCYIVNAMDEQLKTLLMTMAYQRQQELQVALQQLGQAMQMAQDPNERVFLQQQAAQMDYMLKELAQAIQGVEKQGQ